jgi:flagellar biosynthesis/type III secretory pathway chaperone
MPNPNGSSIDERLQFLLQSSESNNEQIGKLTENVQALTADLQALTQESKKHAREMHRFRAAMMAALQAYLADENGEDKT